MTFRLAALSALAALCSAAPVFAASGEPAPRNQTVKSDTDVICEVQRRTGSRLHTKRVCLTRAQWREQQRMQQQDLNIAQRINPGRG